MLIRLKILSFIPRWPLEVWIAIIALIFSITATVYNFKHGYIIAYGDAESHLNIAKRVIQSPTPGLAQLGGVWLPLPHILMIPFVFFDSLWRTGLAGSIISGLAYITTCIYIYKLTYELFHHKYAGLFASLIFAVNPNILYLQSTPMTEMLLICFFMLSSYFFIKYLHQIENFPALVMAALFGFCASLSRYDGWLLIATQAAIILYLYLTNSKIRRIMEGALFLYSTLAFFGVFLWLSWDYLILGDPLYFSNSPFSANSQQKGWLGRGELPTYHNLPLSILYYTRTFMTNSGVFVALGALMGVALYLFTSKNKNKLFQLYILGNPFIFYVLTLFVGQSVIFLPGLTPQSFEWTLFNVRYGVMMIPFVAVFLAYLMSKSNLFISGVVALLVVQMYFFGSGLTKVITLEDGRSGLSASKIPDAQKWISTHYDSGWVLLDDYARTISVVRSTIPMSNVVYIGNKPYWEESIKNPQKYVKWVIIQKDDTLWKQILGNKANEAQLYKYFQKVYTSPEILVFKKNPTVEKVAVK